jgi:hypothetical protein
MQKNFKDIKQEDEELQRTPSFIKNKVRKTTLFSVQK